MVGTFKSSFAFNGRIGEWDTSQVTNMNSMFQRAYKFNQPIGKWDVSKVTANMRFMFDNAWAFSQDITAWATPSNTDCYHMFTGATAWLNRARRIDNSGSVSGPSSAWVPKPCLADERVQSGWCVPCGGMFSLNAAGDDPAAGVDTVCDGDNQALKDAVVACLFAVPSGEACCSTDPDCTDPSLARCGSAGCVDMPDWDVSLVTDMSELFRSRLSSTRTSRRGTPPRSRTWGGCSKAPPPSINPSARGIPRRSRACICSKAPPRSINPSVVGYLQGQHAVDVPRHRRVQSTHRLVGYL